MKIGPDLEITADQYGWTLTHWVPGHAKDGSPKRHKRQTYYASLIQACEAALERIHGRETVGYLKIALERAKIQTMFRRCMAEARSHEPVTEKPQ